MKILLIRFSSIGDIVLTTPVVRCLRLQTGAEVHYLTKNAFQNILTPNPHIHKVWSFKESIGEVSEALRAEEFDCVIDLHKNLRSRRVRWNLGVPATSFNKLNFEKWLLVNFKIDRLPKVHIVDRYLETVRHLGVVNDGRGLDYFIPPEEELNPKVFFSEHGADRDYFTPLADIELQYFAFAIGAAHATKCLPEEKIMEICRSLRLPVVLLGGPEDAAKGARIAHASGPHVVNACGKCSLHGSASLVRQAQKVITHDTGLMHIAAAFSKEIISVWGNTVPEFGMYPYFPEGVDLNTTIQVKGLYCRPCSKIGYERCPKGHFRCMKDIKESSVVRYLSL